jgi:hypothetical protein
MILLRRVHLWLGCFFAPLLLFFVATGCYQTFVHDRKKGLGEAETWVDRLTTIHVDQIYPSASAETFSPQLFQWLVGLMSLALIITLVLGIVLAFRVSRKTWPVWVALLLGFIVPVIVLWLGQGR